MLPSTLDHKDHEISVANQLMMPTRRLINPYVVTPATVSTPISMPTIASRTVMPSGSWHNSNIGRSTTTNTVTPSASDHSKLSSRWDPAPSQQGYELYIGPQASRSSRSIPTMARLIPSSGCSSMRSSYVPLGETAT